jgi:antagonist of KipI
LSTIEVHEPGLLTTVQDLGREGFGPLGVSPSGAADAISLRLGNLLVGNNENAAALEMTLIGGAFRFTHAATIALSGSDFGATLDGAPLAPYESHPVQPGAHLRLGPTRDGARCYLCVQGGIAVETLLGSASTHLLSGLGGLEGRALRHGDVLRINAASAPFRKRRADAQALQALAPRKILRSTAGPQSDWFSASAQRAFYESAWRVAENSNRMGLRLEGAAVTLDPPRELLTEGAPLGAIQIPPSGQPIILFVEQQTTGGYPKIANVISADLHSLGQLRPRDEIRFEPVNFETARSLLLAQERILSSSQLFRETA